ncbi:MAG: hypothetical protein IJV45_02915 [Prevotella sp.]|nr:hypothetical protein [Prevotella sp.]
MNIATRNFLRLLRAGAFDRDERIEPMSAWKWRRVYEVACEQGVARLVFRGIQQLADQFYLQIPDAQMETWRKTIALPVVPDDESALRLTNRQNEKKLQAIIEAEPADSPTLAVLKAMLITTRHILDDGFYLRPLVQLALLLRPSSRRIDRDKLHEWLTTLHMERIAQLEASLIVMFFEMEAESLPFEPLPVNARIESLADDLFSQQHPHTGQLRFTQGNDIFVHTSNSRAMLWQARRSARYFRYYPSESITNLLASFARSLTDIEE